MSTDYTNVNGYLIPSFALPTGSTPPLGKYGAMRARFLDEHRPFERDQMLLDGTPNLNYSVPQDVPQRVPQDVPQDDLDAKILALIKKDNKISTEKLGMALGVSYKTIRRHIKAMGNVHYISRGFSGHWKVDEK